jgi:hypothetical protein
MEKIKGGLADGKTIEDIARKHSVFVGTIKLALEKGINVESEHSSDKKMAREIAMDHLWEDHEYYEKLDRMEKGKCNCKKEETKEQTMADASGSFEGPIFGKTILKKDIHKIHNFKLAEQMDSGVSAGAMYDAPIGTAGPSSPMDKTKKKRKDPLELDEKDEATRTASITAASTKDMISTKKGFPRFGGPEAKFVEIDAKCKKFPYCNQGAGGNKLKFVNEELKEAIIEASKKYSITVQEVKNMISEAVPKGMFDDSNINAMKSWGNKEESNIHYTISTEHPLNITTKNDVDIAKLKLLFYKYDVPFKEHEFKK